MDLQDSLDDVRNNPYAYEVQLLAMWWYYFRSKKNDQSNA